MAKQQDDDVGQIYHIPINFTAESRILNGRLKTRNVIEAAIVSFFLFIFLHIFPISGITTKLTVYISVIGPIAFLFIAGINNEPASTFILSAIKWARNHPIMRYNRSAEAQQMRAVDAILSRQQPADKIQESVNKWREARHQKAMAAAEIPVEDLLFEEDKAIADINAAASRMRREKRRSAAEKQKQQEPAAKPARSASSILVYPDDVLGGDFDG